MASAAGCVKNGVIVIIRGIEAGVVQQSPHDRQVALPASPANVCVVPSCRVYSGILQQPIHSGEMAALAGGPDRCVVAGSLPGSPGRAVATNPQQTNGHTGLPSERFCW